MVMRLWLRCPKSMQYINLFVWMLSLLVCVLSMHVYSVIYLLFSTCFGCIANNISCGKLFSQLINNNFPYTIFQISDLIAFNFFFLDFVSNLLLLLIIERERMSLASNYTLTEEKFLRIVSPCRLNIKLITIHWKKLLKSSLYSFSILILESRVLYLVLYFIIQGVVACADFFMLSYT